MALNLYLVSRTDGYLWDNYDSFVAACENEEEARNTHPSNCEAWRLESWVAKNEIETLTVKYLGVAAPDLKKGVILASFHAG